MAVRNGRLLMLLVRQNGVIYILLEDQNIEVKWASKTKSHYIGLGYQFTGKDNSFTVRAEDLAPSAQYIVKMKCDLCGKEISGPFCRHYERYKNGMQDHCRGCAATFGHSNLKDARALSYFTKLEEHCVKNGYTLITKPEEYTSTKMTIQFKCPMHGIQIMPLQDILKGCLCKPCSYIGRNENSKHSPDQVEEVINSVNHNILLNKEEYVDANHRNLKILCGKCGKNIFVTSYSTYVSKKYSKIQCDFCAQSSSRGEQRIAEYLDAHGLPYIKEKTFDGCCDKHKLPFDFYLPNNNIIIEFDGEHHYYNVWGNRHLIDTKRHDEIKDKFCADNDIDILRIPYWDYNNIDAILDNRLIA